ncbi:MAG: hypothetical protein AAGH81_13725 [Bacteroidota bacterium]
MKKISILFVGLFMLAACSSDDDSGTGHSMAITSFTFLATDNEALSDDVEAVIDEYWKTITVKLAGGTDIRALKPIINVSDKTEVFPETKAEIDFSHPVSYKVVSENDSTIYTVRLVIPYTKAEKEALIKLYRANPVNGLGWDIENDAVDNWRGVTTGIEGLVKLDLAGIDVLPAAIGGLTRLEYLSIYDSGLETLPSEIGELANLKELDITRTNLTALPLEIGNLTNLLGVNINACKLSTLPNSIGKLKHLKFLSLDRNTISTLPNEIGELSNLEHLYIDNNVLTAFPPSIGELSNLRRLSASNNRLTSLPREIGNLDSLVALDLMSNQLSNIPEELCKLGIEELRLDNPLSCKNGPKLIQ